MNLGDALQYPTSEFPILTRDYIESPVLCAARQDLIASMPIPKGGVVAEVGVADGEFSEFLLQVLEPSLFVAIDIFTMHHTPNVVWKGKPYSALLDNMTHADFYRKRLSAWNGQVVIEAGLSHEMLGKQPDQSFDLIYIDASHLYDDVRRDSLAALPKLKDSGVIVFNDYIMYDHNTETPYGVVQAVNELIVENDLRVVGFSLQHHMFCDIAVRRSATRSGSKGAGF